MQLLQVMYLLFNFIASHYVRFSDPLIFNRSSSEYGMLLYAGNQSSNMKRKAKSSYKSGAKKRKWSKQVTEYSNALDLKQGIFAGNDPEKIAKSLRHSAVHSHRKKGTPYQSAMSMLNFYINRAGKNLPESKKHTLEKAKAELRKVFHKDDE